MRREMLLGASDATDSICDQLRLGVPKLCLGHIDFEVGKRCKYLINQTRI